MESYSVFHYTVLFGAPDTRRACLWVTILADAQSKHLLWPCHSHWGMKLRWWHHDITAINTVNCISGLRFLLSFNINLIGIYLKEKPLLSVLFMALFSGLLFSGCFFFFFPSLFLKSDEATHPAIKCSSPILALVNFIGYEQAHRDNYKSAYWKAVKGGCSFFSRPTRLGWNRLVNITSYYNNNTRLNNKKNT